MNNHAIHAHDDLAPAQPSAQELDHQLQKAALTLTQSPIQVHAATIAAIAGIEPQTFPLLWRPQADAAPEATAWLEAVCHIDQTVRDLAAREHPELASAAGLGALLVQLGPVWRRISPNVLAKMWIELASAPVPVPRTTVLELQHVAHWLLHAAPNPRRKDTCWQDDVEEALRSTLNPELHLRRHPAEWEHPHPQLAFAPFDLLPITSTSQLVEQSCRSHHHGALCSVKLAQACSLGLEAWWLGVPRFPGNEVDRVIALGIERDAPDAEWQAAHLYAPPGLRGHGQRAAQSLLARANQQLRIGRLHSLTGTLGASTRSLDKAFVAWLQSLRHTR